MSLLFYASVSLRYPTTPQSLIIESPPERPFDSMQVLSNCKKAAQALRLLGAYLRSTPCSWPLLLTSFDLGFTSSPETLRILVNLRPSFLPVEAYRPPACDILALCANLNAGSERPISSIPVFPDQVHSDTLSPRMTSPTPQDSQSQGPLIFEDTPTGGSQLIPSAIANSSVLSPGCNPGTFCLFRRNDRASFNFAAPSNSSPVGTSALFNTNPSPLSGTP